MGSLIKYAARWVIWQVGGHSAVAEPGQARITFFSAEERVGA